MESNSNKKRTVIILFTAIAFFAVIIFVGLLIYYLQQKKAPAIIEPEINAVIDSDLIEQSESIESEQERVIYIPTENTTSSKTVVNNPVELVGDVIDVAEFDDPDAELPYYSSEVLGYIGEVFISSTPKNFYPGDEVLGSFRIVTDPRDGALFHVACVEYGITSFKLLEYHDSGEKFGLTSGNPCALIESNDKQYVVFTDLFGSFGYITEYPIVTADGKKLVNSRYSEDSEDASE